MHTKTLHRLLQKKSYALSFGAMCVMLSFMLGVQTAGEIHPFDTSEAGEIAEEVIIHERATVPGDMNGNDALDTEDVIIALEIIQEYRTPTLAQLKADPNGDARLTIDDALRMLRSLNLQ